MAQITRMLVSLALVTAALPTANTPSIVARAAADAVTAPQPPRVNESAEVMAAFTARADAYAALRDKLEKSLPRLPDEATPQQIDTNQRSLAALVRAARPAARAGDLFTPDMQAEVRKLMAQVFKLRKERRQLRASITEDNPRGVRLAVNGRYPDAVPLTTMPPGVLQNLPPLPRDLEYRFVGDSLILLDARAHIVVDVMSRALPPA